MLLLMGHSDVVQGLTRTFHVASFSPEALLRLAGLFFPPGLPLKTVRKSGGSTGLCQRGQQAGTVSPSAQKATPGMQMGVARSPAGILFPSLELKIMILGPDLTAVVERGEALSCGHPDTLGKVLQG